MSTATRLPTVDDLLRLGSDARVEVVKGEIVEMTPVGGLHNLVAKKILRLLDDFVEARAKGIVFTDSFLYVLKQGETGIRMARVPDVSYVAREAIPPDWNIERPFPGAPTLAVEVMSPDDQFEEVVQKIRDYFEAGTSEVWVVLPRQQHLYRYRRGESQVQIYRDGETLDATPLLPGLTLPLADVFALPDLG